MNADLSLSRLTILTGAVVLLALCAGGCATAPSALPPPTRDIQAAMTPAQAVERLAAGNARFVAGRPAAREWIQDRARTASDQHPFAIVLSCIDSRSSGETVFDQGIGDIFNVRIAGNVIDDDILGSLEFACQVAGARLIAVVGHSRCGAVKGACSGAELGHLTGLLQRIQPAVAAVHAERPGLSRTDPVFVEAVAEANVKHVLQQIRASSPVLRALLDSGRVGLVGGVHDLATGRVVFLPN